MSPEMPHIGGFGEMPDKETFGSVSKESIHSPKFPEADLNLDEKKLPDRVAKENVIDKKPKKLGKKAAKLEAENKRAEMRLKIKEEISSVKITNDNCKEIIDNIIKKFGIEDEYFKNYITAKAGLRAHVDRNIKRVDYEESRNKEERSDLDIGELSIEDSEWASKICGLIRQSRDNPEEIKEFWKEAREVYMEFEKKYNAETNNFLGMKFGILAQIATEDLTKEISELLEKNNKIGLKQESTSSDDDVYNKTDLKVNSIPYQIKSCKFTGKSADFIFKNMITVIERGEQYSGRFVSQGNQNNDKDNPTYLKVKMGEKMDEFKRKALPAANTKKGVFIMLPRGEARDAITGKVVNLLDDDGRVADIVKKTFFKQYGEKVLGGIDISNYCANIDEPKKQKRK